MYALKLLFLMSGHPSAHDDRYLMEYDPYWREESERVVDDNGDMLLIRAFKTTDDIRKAMHFETSIDALNTWKMTSPNRPTRPDGEPNRPLTAFTVEVARVPT